jgi:hypothetical protein
MLDEEQVGCDHLLGDGSVAVRGVAGDGAAGLVMQALKVAISETPISRARISRSMHTYTETGLAAPPEVGGIGKETVLTVLRRAD